MEEGGGGSMRAETIREEDGDEISWAVVSHLIGLSVFQFHSFSFLVSIFQFHSFNFLVSVFQFHIVLSV